MRKVIIALAIIGLTGACSSSADTSSARMSETECDRRLTAYAGSLVETNEILADVSNPGPQLRREIKSLAIELVAAGRFLIRECGYMDPATASRLGERLDELETAGEGL